MRFHNELRQARLFLLPLLLGSALASCSTSEAPEQEGARLEEIENRLSPALRFAGVEPEFHSIQDRMEHYHVPGVSVAVLNGGEIVWAKGYGVKEVGTDDPVTPETLFQAASISKPVATMAALSLVEEGLLELDEPVNSYLESWKIPDNEFTAEDPVTLRHLVTHTGGLTVHGFPGYALDVPMASTIQVLDGSGPANTDPIRVDTVPGSLWRYSGGGYTIMQLLVEDVAGQPFPEVLRERVLDPAGMTLSSYEQPLPEERAVYASSAHLQDGSFGDGKWHLYPEMAAAGLWTNPTELARLAMDVQASYHGEVGNILSPEMTREQLTQGMGGWGLGFAVDGEGDGAQFSHGGSNYGFKASFTAFKEGGRGVFVMTNGDQGSGLAQEIMLAVAAHYGWPGMDYEEVTVAFLPEEVLRKIAGRYAIPDMDMEIQVFVEEEHLRIEVPDPEGTGDPQVITIYPTAEDRFRDFDEGTRFQIERNEAGDVVAIQALGGPRILRIH